MADAASGLSRQANIPSAHGATTDLNPTTSDAKPSSLPRNIFRKAAKPVNKISETVFLASQVGGQGVINYSYTDFPWKLLCYDIYYFFQFAWFLPWILLPLRPCDSGHLDELSLTWRNVFCCLMHAVLVVLQLGFILSVPFAILFPVWMVVCVYTAFFALNHLLCKLLNGRAVTFESDPKYAEKRPEHAHEQWVFLNGVAVGEHWMKNNLNRLALTFKRPIFGIHNQTSGIIFDVFECLIQRNLGYATYDVRMCYSVLKEKLYNPQFSKIIFILHSQGGIEGGLVLDWLLQELPQDLLSKLEVYTFGNAANHFNNPHRHISSQQLVQQDPYAAVSTTTVETTQTTPASSPAVEQKPQLEHPNGKDACQPSLPSDSSSFPSVRTSSAAQDRAIRHVEHYAHTTDFVAVWGVLHFVRRNPADHTMPRFIGRVFVRASDRGGHQFCQHYLDGMFPLDRDSETEEFTGASEDNEFMESEFDLGVEGAEHEGVREAFIVSYLGTEGAPRSNNDARAVQAYGLRGRHRSRGKAKVKDLSRLWLYRNGMVPDELPPMMRSQNGMPKNLTM